MDKKCTACNELKQITLFAKRKRYKDGRNSRCKKCIAKYRKRWYDKRREMITKIKDVPCKDCGIKYPPYVMQFDHRYPKDKQIEIGTDATNYKWGKILDEVKKCDIVCANCHSIRTYRK